MGGGLISYSLVFFGYSMVHFYIVFVLLQLFQSWEALKSRKYMSNIIFLIAETVNNTSWQFIIKKGLQNLWLCQNSGKFELNLLQFCFHSIYYISSAFQLGSL